MGKRPAEVELFDGNMGSMQREIRPSMQREDTPTMETGLERIAAKARCEPKLRFTSLAHHITRERVWANLCHIPNRSAPGVDGQTVMEAKESFGDGLKRCFNLFTARDIERRIFGECISRNPGNRRSARWGYPVLRPGAPAQRRAGAICHLRARVSTVLVWWTARARCPSCSGDTE